jgi:hypothetical protein
MQFKKIALIGVVLLAVPVVIGIGMIALLGHGMCGVTVLKTAAIDDQMVYLYERNCGATTGFELHLSMLKKEEALGDRMGNLFSASLASWSSTLESGLSLKVDGRDAMTIQLQGVTLDKVFKQEPSVRIQHQK